MPLSYSASSKDTHETLCELLLRKDVGFSIPLYLNQITAMHKNCITTVKAAAVRTCVVLTACTELEKLACLPEKKNSSSPGTKLEQS